MKLSDYVFDFVADKGVKDVFLISGGGNMHLLHSVGTNRRLKYICNHHEQACAMAAEGYARAKDDGLPGVCLVTTGPGGTNAITGVLGAWLDSIPMVVISGQVKRETQIPYKELRQLGDQEINIVDVVKPITKYAVCVKDPKDIRYCMEKAFYLATHGRPGPVWVDIPLDVQASEIDVENQKPFEPQKEIKKIDYAKVDSQIKQVLEIIKKSNRPVLLVGKGIRLAGAHEEFLEMVKKLRIPVITSFSGYDLIENENHYYFGRQGTVGQRGANLIVQNSDALLCVGTRLNTRMVSFNYRAFARAAKKMIVDVDEAELRKPIIKPDLAIVSDAKEFIIRMNKMLGAGFEERKEWQVYCKKVNEKYLIKDSEKDLKAKAVPPYMFFDTLSDVMKENDVMAVSNGFACVGPYQAFKVKKGQKCIVNSGCASMGYGLPAAIGACAKIERKDVVCVEGDGSLQMNIQELATLVGYKLPIKMFVINNGGYLSIRATQNGYFAGKYTGSSENSGVHIPDTEKISKAYGLPYFRLDSQKNLAKKISEILATPGPLVCEVFMPEDMTLACRATSYVNEKTREVIALPLEDMAPRLSKEELKGEMFIPLLDE